MFSRRFCQRKTSFITRRATSQMEGIAIPFMHFISMIGNSSVDSNGIIRKKWNISFSIYGNSLNLIHSQKWCIATLIAYWLKSYVNLYNYQNEKCKWRRRQAHHEIIHICTKRGKLGNELLYFFFLCVIMQQISASAFQSASVQDLWSPSQQNVCVSSVNAKQMCLSLYSLHHWMENVTKNNHFNLSFRFL